MSNHLAIATVTASLRQLVTAGIAGVVAGSEVRTARLDGTGTPAPPDRGVNIYLFQVTPNPAWRNDDLPSRRGDGSLVQRAQAALDLHYLLTFYGSDGDLEPQRLLGATARTLQTHAVLSRDRIRTTIPLFGFLADSDLAEAPELVKLSPAVLEVEELSRLWAMFPQTHYVLSAAYQASVVLIESQARPQRSLPVRSRNLYVVPFQHPVIERLEPAAGADAPVVLGSSLHILGRDLRGEATTVRVGTAEATPAAADISAGKVEISLSSPPFAASALRAGVQAVQVVHHQLMGIPAVPHKGVESALLPWCCARWSLPQRPLRAGWTSR